MLKDGRNWYVYCENNPITKADPTGLVAPIIVLAVVVAVMILSTGAAGAPTHNQEEYDHAAFGQEKLELAWNVLIFVGPLAGLGKLGKAKKNFQVNKWITKSSGEQATKISIRIGGKIREPLRVEKHAFPNSKGEMKWHFHIRDGEKHLPHDWLKQLWYSVQEMTFYIF